MDLKEIFKEKIQECEFPFKSYLSIKKLIDFWDNEASKIYSDIICRSVIEKIDNSGIRDTEALTEKDLKKYHSIIELLVNPVLSQYATDRTYVALLKPFSFDSFLHD